MDWQQIITIIVAIGAVIAGVAWVVLWNKGKNVIKKAQEAFAHFVTLKDEYQSAVADGQITYEEKNRIADIFIAGIEDMVTGFSDLVDIWQEITNAALRIIAIIKNARMVNPSSRAKPK